jgi:hypothetical protein
VLVQNVQLTTNEAKNTNIKLTENNLSDAMHQHWKGVPYNCAEDVATSTYRAMFKHE